MLFFELARVFVIIFFTKTKLFYQKKYFNTTKPYLYRFYS